MCGTPLRCGWTDAIMPQHTQPQVTPELTVRTQMTSRAFQTFEHAIQDADDLLNHFDALNKHPPPPEIEVLKRASLVMALAALETYVEDRIVEAADAVSGRGSEANHLVRF